MKTLYYVDELNDFLPSFVFVDEMNEKKIILELAASNRIAYKFFFLSLHITKYKVLLCFETMETIETTKKKR